MPSQAEIEHCERVLADEDRGRLQPLRRVNMPKTPTVFMREGKSWRHYSVVTDQRVTLVELVPALFEGWRVDRIEIQEGPDSWGDQSQESISSWIEHNRDDVRITDRTRVNEVVELIAKYGAPYRYPRSNPPEDFDKVLIEYAAIPNANKMPRAEGWVPMVWNNGRPILSDYRSRGWDKEPVVEQAQEFAEIEADHYSGDWDVTIQERESNPYTETSTMDPVDDVHGYKGASIELSGPAGGWYWATVRFRSQEKDFEARSRADAMAAAKQWVDEAPELRPNPGEPRRVLIKKYGSPDRAAIAEYGDDREWYYLSGKPVEERGWYVDTILGPAGKPPGVPNPGRSRCWHCGAKTDEGVSVCERCAPEDTEDDDHYEGYDPEEGSPMRGTRNARRNAHRSGLGDFDASTEFQDGVAQALWADVFSNALLDLSADGYDELADELGPGEGDLMDVLPEVPQAAINEARGFEGAVIDANGVDINTIIVWAQDADDVDYIDEEEFGFYLMMSALGTGASWFDNHNDFDIKLPRWEPGAYVQNAMYDWIEHEKAEWDEEHGE
jgi:hypothetical protein